MNIEDTGDSIIVDFHFDKIEDRTLHYVEIQHASFASLFFEGNKIGTTGEMVPVSQKVFNSHRNLLPLEYVGNYTLIVHANHPLQRFSFKDIAYIGLSELQSQQYQRLLLQGFFFGLIIVMCLYNLMIYFSVRDISYLYYVFSILGLGLYLFFFYGFAEELFWPENPKWDLHFFALVIPLTNIARLLFTKSYLHTYDLVPKWDRFLKILIVSYSVPLILWALSAFHNTYLLPITNNIIGTQGILVMSTITLVSVIVLRKGYKPARWFLLAFLLFNVGGILFIFRELGYLPDNFMTRYLLQFGAAAQVILFSLGLADRLNRMRSELASEKLLKEKIAKDQEVEKSKIIQQQKEILEVKINERTKELEESILKLKNSEHELTELNQVKDRLFSIISHDIKNPLTTLDSFLNLLMNHHDKLTKEEFSELSSKTKFALQNLRLLLENLLQWSRLQQNHLPFNPDVVSISKSINKTLKLFSLLIAQKKIRVETKMTTEEVEVWADKDMLEFIFRNLINNALKFTPKGGSVLISILKREGIVLVTVEDTGKGMTKKEIDRILIAGDGFTKSGTENERGNGIGLIMCKDFVERNGGELQISNSSNGGTKVTFEVPYYDQVGAITI